MSELEGRSTSIGLGEQDNDGDSINQIETETLDTSAYLTTPRRK